MRLEELVHTLQREVSSKGSSLAWLEDQASCCCCCRCRVEPELHVQAAIGAD